MISWIFVALLQAVAGDPAAPAPEAPAAAAETPAATAAPAQPEMRRVCRREDVTGRRFGRRICTMEPVEAAAPAETPAATEPAAQTETSGGGGSTGAIEAAPAPEATQP